MTNLKKLAEIYKKKQDDGLVDVNFAWTDKASNLTTQELAGDVLLLENSISKGDFRKLGPNDNHF